jgi:hypothetical protein
MFRFLKRAWIRYVTWPRMRRRLRDGVVAVQWLNQAMIEAKYPRQRRRHILRDIDRDPGKLMYVLDLLYTGRRPQK